MPGKNTTIVSARIGNDIFRDLRVTAKLHKLSINQVLNLAIINYLKTEVGQSSIPVGKITPKGETELSAEE